MVSEFCSSVILPFSPGFVASWGQSTCKTNGKGPEIYSRCASGTVYTKRGTNDSEEYSTNCIFGHPKIHSDVECRSFNYRRNEEVSLLHHLIFYMKYLLVQQSR